MKNKPDILQELEEISPAVANIGNNNVYSAPDGYFNSLPETALMHVRLAGVKERMPYTVPAGYFDTIAGDVLGKIHQDNTVEMGEDIAIKGIAQAQTAFTVPEGYFDGLAGDVMAKIKALELQKEKANDDEQEVISAFLPGIKLPYTVPAGYFNSLADNVLLKIKIVEHQYNGNEVFAELDEIAPLLNSINKAMPYAVPEGYFEQLTINLPIAEKPVAKVVSIASHSRRKWVMYAVAACVAVLLGVGGYMFIPSRGGDAVDPIKAALAGISTDDLNSYLDSQPLTTTEASASASDEQEPDVETELNNMSTQDIQQYLNENSDPGENGGKHI